MDRVRSLVGREVWRDFICSPYHAGRHLSFIGRGVAGSVSDAVDLETLRTFLDRLTNASNDVQFLGNAVDLITGGYLEFVQGPLGSILDALSNEMLREEEVVGPALRGNPRWDKTLVQRLSGKLSATQYVSGTARRSFDLPENRLLSWLVHDLLSRVDEIERRVGSQALHPDLQTLRRLCMECLSHHWFSTVSRPIALEYGFLLAAKGHRRVEYRKAAALVARRKELEAKDDRAWWYAVLSLLSVNWLEPVSDDDLFELYVLVLVLDVIANELDFGTPTEFGLLTTGRRHVALFEKTDETLAVYFDQSPALVLGSPTAYGEVLRGYNGISGSERRPDLMLVVTREGEQRTVLVEAKRTSDGPYISDSIYKVFAYLHDFRHGGLDPRAVLVIPSGVMASVPFTANESFFLVSGDQRAELKKCLVAALS